MGVDVAAGSFKVELRERRVVGTGSRQQHMIDRLAQLGEEAIEPVEVGGVERRGVRADLDAGLVQASGLRAVMTTSAPASRALRAVSSPMPALPPMTRTRCPSCWPLMMIEPAQEGSASPAHAPGVSATRGRPRCDARATRGT